MSYSTDTADIVVNPDCNFPVCARALGVVAVFACPRGLHLDDTWSSPAAAPEHYRSAKHPGSVLKVRVDEKSVHFACRVGGRATADRLLKCAESVLGAAAKPQTLASLPVALRVELEKGRAQVELPGGRFRCYLVEDSEIVDVQGQKVELRLSATKTSARPPRLAAEAFLAPHWTGEGEPRAFIYTGDLLRVPWRYEHDVAPLVRRVLAELARYVQRLESRGFRVSKRRRYDLKRVASVVRRGGVDKIELNESVIWGGRPPTNATGSQQQPRRAGTLPGLAKTKSGSLPSATGGTK